MSNDIKPGDTVYLLCERSFAYNDEYYSRGEGGPQTRQVFTDPDRAYAALGRKLMEHGAYHTEDDEDGPSTEGLTWVVIPTEVTE